MGKNNKKFNTTKASFLYSCSFLLIYPIFLRSKKEKYLIKKLRLLAYYKQQLVSLVILKQKALQEIYKDDGSNANEKINSLLSLCVRSNISEDNFSEINGQMDEIDKLISFKKTYEKLKNKYLEAIWPYTDQIKMISQYYYSILGKIRQEYGRYPWKYLLEIYKFSKFEITI